MPTDQPSSAPQKDAPHPIDDLNAPALLHDDALDQPAGGGGLGGAGAGAGPQVSGAASPNSPIDAELPHDAGSVDAAAEARTQALGDTPADPGNSSR